VNKNNKGIALIIVLILSFIALALVGTTLSLVRHSTNISGSFISYQTALEAAKGGVDLSIARLLSLDCDNSSLSGNLSLQTSTLGSYTITSKVLDKYWYPTVDSLTGNIIDHCIYSIEVQSLSSNKSKAIIDVVVKVE
jgi:hypothetical protein